MLSNFIEQFASLTIGGLSLGFIYVLIALGYTMVYGVLRMINFANSEIFMYGTFATVIVARDFYGFTQSSETITGLRLIVVILSCLLASMLLSGILSIFLELVAYRRLRNRGSNKLAPLISAIGMSIVLAESMRIMTNSRYVGSPRFMEKKSLGTVFGGDLRLDIHVLEFELISTTFIVYITTWVADHTSLSHLIVKFFVSMAVSPEFDLRIPLH